MKRPVTSVPNIKSVTMNTINEAYQLHLEGLSYKQIATKLGIGKTTAFNYVKEVKLQKGATYQKHVQNRSELGVRQNSELLQKHSESENTVEQTPFPVKKNVLLKEFTGHDLVRKKFHCLEFEGKFKELIGKPSRIFSAIIWGLPKGGKSNLALRFADYLQEYFGKTIYIAAEEGESVTLQEKFRDIGGSKLTVVESRNRDDIREYLKQSDAEFVFIDSINTASIDNDYLELLKVENKKKSFIGITQATKGGTFKGDQALTHNCDFIIKVVDGVAYHSGRFNQASEIKIFEEPLYKKNKNAISSTAAKLSSDVKTSGENSLEVHEGATKPLPAKYSLPPLRKPSFQAAKKPGKSTTVEAEHAIIMLILFGVEWSIKELNRLLHKTVN